MIVGALYLDGRQHGDNLFAPVAREFGGVPVPTIQVGTPVAARVAVEQLL